MLHKFNIKISDDITLLAYQRTMELVSPENNDIDIIDDFVPLLLGFSEITLVISQDAIASGELDDIKEPQLDTITPIGFLVSYKNKGDDKTDLLPFSSIQRYSFYNKRNITDDQWEEIINKYQSTLG